MIATSVERVTGWQSVLAAMLYLSTFLAVGRGIYSLARDGDFLVPFASAFALTLAASLLLFACSSAVEAMITGALKKRMRNADPEKRVVVHSLIHH